MDPSGQPWALTLNPKFIHPKARNWPDVNAKVRIILSRNLLSVARAEDLETTYIYICIYIYIYTYVYIYI